MPTLVSSSDQAAASLSRRNQLSSSQAAGYGPRPTRPHRKKLDPGVSAYTRRSVRTTAATSRGDYDEEVRTDHLNWERWHSLPAAIRGIAVGLAFMIVLVVFLHLFDWNLARHAIGRLASGIAGREVRIEGPLAVKLFSTAPNFELRQLRVQDPQWFGSGTMATVEKIRGSIEIAPLFRGRLVFRTLEIEKPDVRLARDATGRANWWMRAVRREAALPPDLPAARDFHLRNGRLRIDDTFRKLKFSGTIAANEGSRNDTAQPFRLFGEGTLNGERFRLAFTGDSLAGIRIDQPYDFTATVDAGPTHGRFRGKIEKPFDLARYSTMVDVSGRNLADLYYLTGLPLPLTSDYRLTTRMKRDGTEIALREIVGRVGKSDLRGTAIIRTDAERPLINTRLLSHSLSLRDLGVAFGGEPVETAAGQGIDSDSPSGAAPDRLLPDRNLRFDRLAQIDANLDFRADTVQTSRVPLQSVMIKLNLTDGVMRLNPFVFTLPQGRLAGTLTVNTRAPIPEAEADLRVSGVRLEAIKTRKGTEGPFSGTLAARAHVNGSGRSVHEIASTSDGSLTAVLPRGEIREAIAELTGINLLHGLGLLLTQSDETAQIRCGVAEFRIDHGRARAQRIVLDTENVLVIGGGNVGLEDEELDIELRGKSKEPRIGRLRSPVTIGGTLSDPVYGIKIEKAALQGGIATVLGALVAPIAAALAFVDPGLAKDADCAALLAEAGTSPVSPASLE